MRGTRRERREERERERERKGLRAYTRESWRRARVKSTRGESL